MGCKKKKTQDDYKRVDKNNQDRENCVWAGSFALLGFVFQWEDGECQTLNQGHMTPEMSISIQLEVLYQYCGIISSESRYSLEVIFRYLKPWGWTGLSREQMQREERALDWVLEHSKVKWF